MLAVHGALLLFPHTPSGFESPPEILPYPKASSKEFVLPDGRKDNYYWMKDSSVEVIDYINRWNHNTSMRAHSLKPLEEALLAEYLSREGEELSTHPVKKGDHEYFAKYIPGKEHPIFYRTLQGCICELLIDMNLEAKTPYFSVKNMRPSPDGKWLAFLIDVDGTQFGSLKIFDTALKKWVLSIPASDGQFAWSSDSQKFYFLAVNELYRACQLVRFSIDGSKEVIYEELDPVFDLVLTQEERSGKIFLTSLSKESSEIWLVETEGLKKIRDRIKSRYEVLFPNPEEAFLVSYHYEKNGALYQSKDYINWKLLKPSDPEVDYENIRFCNNHTFILKKVNGFTKIEILGEGDLSLPSSICEITFVEDENFRFIFSSPLIPPTLYEWNSEKKKLQVLRKESVKGFNASHYSEERLNAQGQDGISIPITLVKPRNEAAKSVLLYGYGAYGSPVNPAFSLRNAMLLERGIAIAWAHVRGGGELGRRWYHAGRLLNKKNTFTDFIAAAEKLKNLGYRRIALEGASAGGLLVAVSINRRPELFEAAVIDVPFLDVITTLSNEKSPFTLQDRQEWGDPNDPEILSEMLRYDPYHNIKSQSYPAIKMTSGLKDAQVPFYEALKWISKLIEYNTSQNPIYFKTYLEAGHLGSSGKSSEAKEKAETMAFLMDQLLKP